MFVSRFGDFPAYVLMVLAIRVREVSRIEIYRQDQRR